LIGISFDFSFTSTLGKPDFSKTNYLINAKVEVKTNKIIKPIPL